MNRFIAYVAVLALTTGVVAEEKKPAPVQARIVMSGKPTGSVKWSSTQTKTTIQNGKEVTTNEKKELTVTLFKLDDQPSLAVALPPIKNGPPSKGEGPKEADPDLARLLKLATMDEETAVEGTLSSTDDVVVIAMTGSKGAKRIPILIADRQTPLNESNKKKYPSLNSAKIEGIVIESKMKLGSESVDWAIQQDGVGSIPILVSKDISVPAAGSIVRVTGPVRLMEGRFTIRAKDMHILDKK